MTELLLPLFPLKVVLFPRTEIPLHIFEDRYKMMIGECLASRSEFGIVLVLEEGLASTGCTAAIAEVIRKFEDGRMDIVVRGQQRFELVRLDQGKSYLRGVVQFFEDEDDHFSPPDSGEDSGGKSSDDSSRKQALELYEQMAEILAKEQSGDAPPPGIPDIPGIPSIDDPQLSFQIASRLPVDITFRQTLLQIRSEAGRLARVISYLQKLAVRLTRMSQAQAKAGANGRAH